MNEKEFWEFLNSALEKGRTPQISSVMDSDDPYLQQAGKFMGGHSLLPKDYDKISTEKIVEIGRLIMRRDVALSTKEAALMLLAHHPTRQALSALKAYSNQPDEELKYFAQMALDECKMWNK